MKRKPIFVLHLALVGLAVAVLTSGVAGAARPIETALSQPQPQSAARPGQDRPAQPMAPVGTAFTYQGQLKDGAAPANGSYDLQFSLYDAGSGGIQWGMVEVPGQTVADGLFTVLLDFGTTAIVGQARWLEIAVRPAGGGTYTTLSPRQPLTAAPYAQSLVPGSLTYGDMSGAIVGAENSTGNGLEGTTYGGNTEAGVYGRSYGAGGNGVWGDATSSTGIGVLGTGNNVSTLSTGVYGYAGGTGVTGFGAQRGIYGLASGVDALGVHGVADNGAGAVGVRGQSASGTGGYFSSSGQYGVRGETSTTYAGVWGNSTAAANGTGVYGSATNVNGKGVWGVAGAGSQAAGVRGECPSCVAGVRGISGSSTGYGVWGSTAAGDQGGAGVYGEASGTNGRGVYGISPAYSGTGVWGEATNTNGWGVYGVGSGSPDGIGVYGSGYWGILGESSIPTGNAGVFGGNTRVYGDLYVSGSCCTAAEGSYRIDHPVFPANKYLYQAAVESPDMMNVYNGNVTLNAKGEAIVSLPSYVQALNKEFRYQLTAIGAPGPDLYVAQEIAGNSFKVAGGKAGMKVSWQVTGVRKDPYAQAHPVQAEVDKPANEQGTYLHPELYGQPESKGVNYQDLQKIKQARPGAQKP